MTENKSPVAVMGYGLPRGRPKSAPSRGPQEIDPFIIHEGIDRAYMVHHMVEAFLREHQMCAADEKFRTCVEAASQSLFDAYQRAGELS